MNQKAASQNYAPQVIEAEKYVDPNKALDPKISYCYQMNVAESNCFFYYMNKYIQHQQKLLFKYPIHKNLLFVSLVQQPKRIFNINYPEGFTDVYMPRYVPQSFYLKKLKSTSRKNRKKVYINSIFKKEYLQSKSQTNISMDLNKDASYFINAQPSIIPNFNPYSIVGSQPIDDSVNQTITYENGFYTLFEMLNPIMKKLMEKLNRNIAFCYISYQIVGILSKVVQLSLFPDLSPEKTIIVNQEGETVQFIFAISFEEQARQFNRWISKNRYGQLQEFQKYYQSDWILNQLPQLLQFLSDILIEDVRSISNLDEDDKKWIQDCNGYQEIDLQLSPGFKDESFQNELQNFDEQFAAKKLTQHRQQKFYIQRDTLGSIKQNLIINMINEVKPETREMLIMQLLEDQVEETQKMLDGNDKIGDILQQSLQQFSNKLSDKDSRFPLDFVLSFVDNLSKEGPKDSIPPTPQQQPVTNLQPGMKPLQAPSSSSLPPTHLTLQIPKIGMHSSSASPTPGTQHISPPVLPQASVVVATSAPVATQPVATAPTSANISIIINCNIVNNENQPEKATLVQFLETRSCLVVSSSIILISMQEINQDELGYLSNLMNSVQNKIICCIDQKKRLCIRQTVCPAFPFDILFQTYRHLDNTMTVAVAFNDFFYNNLVTNQPSRDNNQYDNFIEEFLNYVNFIEEEWDKFFKSIEKELQERIEYAQKDQANSQSQDDSEEIQEEDDDEDDDFQNQSESESISQGQKSSKARTNEGFGQNQ